MANAKVLMYLLWLPQNLSRVLFFRSPKIAMLASSSNSLKTMRQFRLGCHVGDVNGLNLNLTDLLIELEKTNP